MAAILKKITKMIDADQDETKCAAIRVLGELGLKERAVLKKLGEKLTTDSDSVKNAILDSFIKNPQTAALSYLLPLLKTDAPVRRKAIHAIAAIGPKAVSLLDKEFKAASLQEKKLFIDIMSTIRSRATVDFLVGSLLEGDIELLKYICFSLRNQIEKMDRADKLYLLERVKKFLDLESVRNNDEMTTSGVLLLGFISEPQVKKVVLKFLDRKRSFYVRKNALVSLTRLNLAGKGHDDVVTHVFPLLGDADFPNVVRNALTILEKLVIPKRLLSQFPKMLESTKHPAVKKFLLMRLAESGNAATIKLLITHLDSTDPTVRDAAADSLGKLPKAVPELLKKIETVKEVDRGEKIALILRNHRSFFKAERSRAIYRKLEKALLKGNEQAKIYSHLLKQVNPDLFYAETLKRARQYKRSKKYELSKRFFDMLATGLFYTDEVRYEMAGLLLKLSKKDLAAQARHEDPALNLFSMLARMNLTNVIKRVKAERAFDYNDLYYLGFHFSEKMFEQKTFGVEVLKFLLKKYPKSKVKAAAKKKLELAGPAVSAKDQAFQSGTSQQPAGVLR